MLNFAGISHSVELQPVLFHYGKIVGLALAVLFLGSG